MEKKQMEYMQFKERLIEALQEYFLGRGEVYYDKVKKMNDTDKDAVIVRLIGTAVQAMIYPEDMYKGYKDTGDFEKCVKEVIRACEEVPFVDECHIPKTWESAKGRLHMRVINKNWNKQALKRMPYREYLDLAIVFYVFIKEEGGLMATQPVSRECMKLWGVDVKSLWETSRKNLEEEVFQIETMGAVIENMLTEMKDSEDAGMFWNDMEGKEIEGIGKVYVVTNTCKKYGARAILRKDLLQRLAKEQGGSFYILPCSVHEILILKEDGMVTAENLRNMVYEINHCSGTVEPEECLSDSVYYYNKDEDRVEVAA
ncbi:DUF5688 family protein [Lachnospiraceae bacterium 48-21]|uniref:DUF5688 family protein n=1 Tax=Sporofaciens musculi TaxID=2681861 RepID=UPI00259CD490|nr:DUF5688 family protein [Sporofaciens musculi]